MRGLSPALACCHVSDPRYGAIRYTKRLERHGSHLLPVARFAGGATVSLYHVPRPDGSWARVYEDALS